MRDIEALLFGADPDETGETDETCVPQPGRLHGPPTPDEAWCQTQPGDETLSWVAATLGVRRGGRGRRGRF